jgi:hypothetical protein
MKKDEIKKSGRMLGRKCLICFISFFTFVYFVKYKY